MSIIPEIAGHRLFDRRLRILTTLASGLVVWIACLVESQAQSQSDARKATAIRDIFMLESAIIDYADHTGSIPSEAEGLEALVKRPRSMSHRTPWRQMLKAIPTDPWSQSFHYKVDEKYPLGFGIYSRGPNGISRSEGEERDDLASWREDSADGEVSETSWLTVWGIGIAVVVGLIVVFFVFGNDTMRSRI